MFEAQSIAQFVEEHRGEAVVALQEIVQTPSVTGNEEAVSYVFVRLLKEAGFKVDRYKASKFIDGNL